MSVLIIQHVPWEGPGRLGRALDEAGIAWETRLLLDEADPVVPPLDELTGLVIMGGPMGADDVEAHPALGLERDLARRAVEAGIPVLGICLGHQILTLALGGRLEPGATAEIGVAPIELIADAVLGQAGSARPVLHWHFDNAIPPEGAQVLARTAGCPNQAFRLGSALGLQFHLEVDPPLLDAWLAVDEVRDEVPGDPEQVRRDLAAASEDMASMADAVFGDFVLRVRAYA